jgi:hypothetical protein
MNRIESGGGLCRPRHALGVGLLGLAFLIVGQAKADLHIKQVDSLDNGIIWTYGYIVPFESASNGRKELIFEAGFPNGGGDFFYGYHRMNRYSLLRVDTGNMGSGFIPGNMSPWASGVIYGDSQEELVADNGDGRVSTFYLLAVLYRQNARTGVPDSVDWCTRYDSLQTDYGEPFYITDLDQDGKKEITFQHDARHEIFIFECDGPDSFHLASVIPARDGGGLAFGDFDQDGKMEFADGTIAGSVVQVFKCTGNDQYVLWDTVSAPGRHPNGDDVFEGKNLDGTHHAVFFASFFDISTGWEWLYEFSPGPDSHYRAIPVDSATFSSDAIYARSICGDIDGDGIDELIWSMGTQIRVYKRIDPHQYQQVWSWWNGGGNSCNVNLYDMNGNGYNEILESGSGRTNIFEIEAIRVLNPNTNITLHPGDTCRIRWKTFTPPRCDSVSLFLRTDTSWTLDTLIHGLPPNDTDWVWTVPEIRSDYCHVVAIAYGPGWQYDESDTFFQILPLGVEESAALLVRETKLLGAYPNPCAGTMRLSFQIGSQGQSTTRQSLISLRICDVSGRTVATLADGVMRPGVYHRDWEAAPTVPNGVYFVLLAAPDCRESQKVILAR